MAKIISMTEAAIPVLKTVIEKKSTIPVLTQVLVVEGALGWRYAIGTDLDHAGKVRVNDNLAPGLYAIIGKELVPSQMKVESYPVTAFTSGFEPKFGGVRIGAETLARLLTCISKEESRYTINAALIRKKASGGVEVVSTDGHRMIVEGVFDEKETLVPGDYLIPRETLKLGLRHGKKSGALFQIGYAHGEDEKTEGVRKYIRVCTQNAEFISRGMSGQFPNYAAVMPNKSPFQVSVTTAEFLAALETVKPFANPLSSAISFKDAGGKLEITGAHEGFSKTVELPFIPHSGAAFMQYRHMLAEPGAFLQVVMPMRGDKSDMDEVPIVHDDGTTEMRDGKPLTKLVPATNRFGLNADYLIDMVRNAKSERLYIGWQNAQNALLFSTLEQGTGAGIAKAA